MTASEDAIPAFSLVPRGAIDALADGPVRRTYRGLYRRAACRPLLPTTGRVCRELTDLSALRAVLAGTTLVTVQFGALREVRAAVLAVEMVHAPFNRT